MYTVYKHLNDNEEIIYIGKSKSLLHRQRQHSKNSEWFDEIDSIEYCTLNSKIEMDIAELYLINILNPKYNKKDSRNDKVDNINIKELNWLRFDMNELLVMSKKEDKIKNDISDYENFVILNLYKFSHFILISDKDKYCHKIEKFCNDSKLIYSKNFKFKYKDIILCRDANISHSLNNIFMEYFYPEKLELIEYYFEDMYNTRININFIEPYLKSIGIKDYFNINYLNWV